MKAQCERCKEIVELRFGVAAGGAGIEVDCPACRATYRVSATAAAAVAAPAAVAVAPEAVAAPAPAPAPASVDPACPKCGHPRAAAPACTRCGLVFERWNPASALARATLDPALRAEGEALWAAVEARWDDAAPHDALLSFCQRRGQLAWVAACYRQARQGRGGAAEAMSARGLENVEKLAFAALAQAAATESGDDRVARRRKLYAKTVLVAIVVLAIGGLIYALARGTRHPGDEGRTAVPGAPARRPAAPSSTGAGAPAPLR